MFWLADDVAVTLFEASAMIFVSQASDGSRVEYRDGKRYLWVLSVLSPAMPLVAVLLLVWTGATVFAADGVPV